VHAVSRTPQRILGVVPPTGVYVREDRCQTPIRNFKTIALRPPIDLMYAAAAFESVGADCRLVDYPAEGTGWEALRRDLQEFRPDVVVISATTQTLAGDMEAAALAKSVVPGVLTVAKGAHFSVLAGETLNRFPALDVALRGEIEESCLDLGRGVALAEVAGISWRRADGLVVHNPERPFTASLDGLPFPARHLVRNELYVRPDTGERQTTIVTNRGCPFLCVYCLANLTAGVRNRYRSVANVLAEIRESIDRHGIRSFLFRSELFTQNKAWVIEFCRAVVDAGLDIEWACNSRVDTIDLEMLQWMRRAGCWIMAFGVESGDQQTLDRIDKKAKVEDSFAAVALCREAGIRSSVYLLIGLPWDSPATMEAQRRFARALDPDVLEVFYSYPFPGTPLHRICVEHGLLRADEIPVQSYDSPAYPTLHMGIAELKAQRARILRSFYLRPKTAMRLLGGIRSRAELINYVRVGAAQLRMLTLGS